MRIHHHLFLLLHLLPAISMTASNGVNTQFSLSSYETVIPQKITSNMSDELMVSYAIKMQGKEHIIHLKKEVLSPGDSLNSTHDKELTLHPHFPTNESNCFYKGYIVDVPNSSVTLTTCSGLRGLLHAGNVSYWIKPLDFSQFQHLIYPLMSKSRNMHGFAENDIVLQRKKRDSLPAWQVALYRDRDKMVMLYLVMDQAMFQNMGLSESDVFNRLIKAVLQLSMIFWDIKLSAILKGVDIWKDGNKISVEGSALEILARFMLWRQSHVLPRVQHDVAYLLVYRQNPESPGKTTFGGVCTHKAGGVLFYSLIPENVRPFAAALGHMVGHAVGMKHDNGRNCKCGRSYCLMNTLAFVNYTATLSDCSAADFDDFLLRNEGLCLIESRDNTSPGSPLCWDYVLQPGEDCDCQDGNNCNGRGNCCLMCTLTKGSTCSFGECCINCKKPSSLPSPIEDPIHNCGMADQS
ncbi:disintegrin and metalloproteinase domain-containing protein 9-like [Rhinatrema bivittatum]|uniref:disintegrin and metalloproteinase domain-containing protein 9-like n=1 Tax=Rhinatrema bivittatum TaxID=194408 RepID=UPI00112DC178|nr:disintegrin and metalloproteinase domain-containing protein 9-like [Rhinatrema bivittatum]